MKSKNAGKVTVWLLIFSLIFGFIIPQKYQAETVSNISNTTLDVATTIKNGDMIEGTFEQPDVNWYQITPTKDEIAKYSHMKLEVNSDQVVSVSVYSSKENAEKDQTFEQYITGTTPGSPAVIQFPYAWDGPYYIKVEYSGPTDISATDNLGLTDMSSLTDTSSSMTSDQSPTGGDLGSVHYTLQTSSVKLPPNTEDSAGSTCPIESSVSGKSSATEILKDIRLFRDGILSKTEQGRQLTSLYYKTAPFLLAKMVFNKSIKDNLYKNLVSIQPLIVDLNNNGVNSSRVISKDEAQAINALYQITRDAVPSKLRTQMEALAKKANLTSLAGERLVNVTSNVGVELPNSASNGEYIIKLKPGKTLSSIKSTTTGTNVLSTLSVNKQDQLFDNMYVVHLKDQKDSGMSIKAQEKSLQATVSQVEKLPEVEYVEPVKTYHALSNDIQYSYQWSLKNLGEDEGVKGADIRYDKLQKLVSKRNVKDTLIAVVDTGVDYTLADLKNRVRTDIGKNFVDKNLPPMDDNGHGTHVSGIIAAESNNGYSMAGIDQKAKILPVKVLNADGSGNTEQIAYGIRYAVDHGAKVINLSLGGSYSRTLEAVLQYAASKNVVVVVASGNDGQEGLSYPANSRYVISVGATNTLDIVSDYSNYGQNLDLVAPGTNIPSIVPNGNVTYMSGTSMAAPHVTAVAGLLLSGNPKLKVTDVRNILHKTADYIAFEEKDNKDSSTSLTDIIGNGLGTDTEDSTPPIGSDLVSGFGRLNAFSAFSTVDLKVKVNPILENQTKVNGTTIKGAKVEVKKGTKVIGKAVASSKGSFSVKIPAQKVKQRLGVTVTDQTGIDKATLAIYVAKDNRPSAPKVKGISNKSTHVIGKAKSKITIIIKNASKKVIGKGKANSKGQFKIKIKKQKAGTILYITSVDSAKRSSKVVKVVVKDKITPAVPKVKTITSDTVKGTAEKDATVIVKAKGKIVGKAKTDKKGNFSVKIKKQTTGTILYVTARDKAGNTSKAKKVAVK